MRVYGNTGRIELWDSIGFLLAVLLVLIDGVYNVLVSISTRRCVGGGATAAERVGGLCVCVFFYVSAADVLSLLCGCSVRSSSPIFDVCKNRAISLQVAGDKAFMTLLECLQVDRTTR